MNAHAIVSGAAQAARLGQNKPGVVVHTDPVMHAVKVRLEPEGTETGWMPDMTLAAGGLRVSCLAEEGTQVLVAPMHGDIESGVVIARIMDVVVLPPTSPQTGAPAQPGELLVMAGQGKPPINDGGSVGPQTDGAGWFHVTDAGFFAGAGNTKLAITQAGITITVGSACYTFGPTELALMGAAFSTDQDATAGDVSLKEHVHVDAGGSGLSGTPRQ